MQVVVAVFDFLGLSLMQQGQSEQSLTDDFILFQIRWQTKRTIFLCCFTVQKYQTKTKRIIYIIIYKLKAIIFLLWQSK